MIQKKEVVFIFLVVVLFNLSFVFADNTFAAVEGVVYDGITKEPISDPVVEINYGGRVIVDARTAESDDAAGVLHTHTKGHYNTDAEFIPVSVSVVTVTAHSRINPSCKGSESFNLPGGNQRVLENANIYLCCEPTSASNFNPKSIVMGTESVDLNWNKGAKTGYSVGESKYKFWQVFNGFGISQEDIGSVENKHIDLGEIFGNWGIETCAGNPEGDASKNEYCCVSTSSLGKITNGPCPEPENLIGEYEKGNGFIRMFWDSVEFDEEGHACYDKWRAVSVAEGEALDLEGEGFWDALDYENAISGEEVVGAELATYWEVQSCDIYDNCSKWVVAITPSCNEITEDCFINHRSGGGLMWRDSGNLLERPLPQIDSWWKSLLWLLIRFLILMVIVLYEQERRRKKLYKKGGNFKVRHIKIKHHGFQNKK